MNMHFESLLRRAHELRDMVDVNLGLASSAESEDRVTLYRNGLARAAQRLQELTEDYRKRLEAVLGKAEESIQREFRLIETCFQTQHFTPMTDERQRLQREDQAVTLWNRTVSLWCRGVDAFLIWYRHDSGIVIERTQTLRQWLGFISEDHTAPVARSRASDYLNETERRLSQLPLIYKSLFNFEPDCHPRYLKGRDANLNSLSLAHDQWRDGVFTTVVLVGEEGSGKKSLLDRFLLTTLADKPVSRVLISVTITTEEELLTALSTGLGVPDAADFPSLISSLKDGHRRYVVLDGMQNLYLRHMNGIEAMERFQLFFTESASHVFWLVTCTRYAWNYLDDAIHVSASFTPSEREKRSRAYKKLLNSLAERFNHRRLLIILDKPFQVGDKIEVDPCGHRRRLRGIHFERRADEQGSVELVFERLGLPSGGRTAVAFEHQSGESNRDRKTRRGYVPICLLEETDRLAREQLASTVAESSQVPCEGLCV